MVSINPFTPKISLVLDSPYCLPNNSCDVILENLVLDQLMIPKLIFVSILITCLLDVVSKLEGEIQSWSLMGVKGFTKVFKSLELIELNIVVETARKPTLKCCLINK